jgi:phasin family protein
MAQATSDFNSFIEFQKTAFAPIARFNEAGVRTFEKIMRHQFAIAGDVLDFGIAQLNAIANAKDPAAFASTQSGLAADFVHKQTSRSTDFIKLATEVQSEFGRLVEAAVDEAPAPFKAAKAA